MNYLNNSSIPPFHVLTPYFVRSMESLRDFWHDYGFRRSEQSPFYTRYWVLTLTPFFFRYEAAWSGY